MKTKAPLNSIDALILALALFGLCLFALNTEMPAVGLITLTGSLTMLHLFFGDFYWWEEHFRRN